jgi:5,10-methenyltetrahydrofolate synthetase
MLWIDPHVEKVVTPEEIKPWRKALRAQLVDARNALAAETLARHRESIDRHLKRGFPGLARGVLAFCWPHRGEYDARFLAHEMREQGAVTALPVVVAPRTALVFREWHPGVALGSGVLGIPFPAHSREVTPDSVLVPLVGFDDAGYRLGYGGGFFDRTLAALSRRPLVIGVGYETAHVDTIHPQPHDVPMDWIVTERGIYRRDGARLEFLGAPAAGEPSALSSPVCYAGELDPDYFGGRSSQ